MVFNEIRLRNANFELDIINICIYWSGKFDYTII